MGTNYCGYNTECENTVSNTEYLLFWNLQSMTGHHCCYAPWISGQIDQRVKQNPKHCFGVYQGALEGSLVRICNNYQFPCRKTKLQYRQIRFVGACQIDSNIEDVVTFSSQKRLDMAKTGLLHCAAAESKMQLLQRILCRPLLASSWRWKFYLKRWAASPVTTQVAALGTLTGDLTQVTSHSF